MIVAVNGDVFYGCVVVRLVVVELANGLADAGGVLVWNTAELDVGCDCLDFGFVKSP